MLNIPETVKALYKRDGVYKNFRCHFPDGEMSDITNENIVQESVQFTESICSQDVFKFGLAEASTIEFETVGIGNMYGMTIECSSEIDCSSLSAAEKSDIAAGTWDGTWDSENEVFSVPYGTFRVEECPRDHQAMAHRRVLAYTEVLTDTNPFEMNKDALMLTEKTYKPDISALVLGQIARRSQKSLLDNGYTATTVTMSNWPVYGSLRSPIWDKTATLKDENGNDLEVTFRAYGTINQGSDDYVSRVNLWSVDYTAIDDGSVFDTVVEELESLGVDAEQSGFASLLQIAKANLPKSVKPFFFYYFPQVRTISASLIQENQNMIINVGNGEVVYPFRGVYSDDMSGYTTRPVTLICYTSLSVGGTTVWSNGSFVVKRYEPTTQSTISITFENTLKQRITLSDDSRKMAYSFADAFSAVDIAQGYLELSAWFAIAQRSGGLAIRRLSSTSPVPLGPGDYSQFWFDEYSVEPIGTVRYAYTDDADEEQVVDYVFGDGASVYDMTDNAVLKIMDNASPSAIESFLQVFFIPYLGTVSFLPIDMEMKGLPYIEAGDAITVTAQDGTVCNSYVLRQTQTGVQALRSQVDSQSGLIIDSEEA